MNAFHKNVQDKLKDIHSGKPVKNSAYGAYLHERDIKFGDSYSMSQETYSRQDVCYLLRQFPPCKTYKHSDSCTGYIPSNKPQKGFHKPHLTIKQVNPVVLWCDGLESYNYTLVWYTRLNNTYYKVKVLINYGRELIKIDYDYNDRRSLPKYDNFKAKPVKGLNAIKYGRGSYDYMQKFAVEVIDKNDTDFFITQGE